MSIDCGKHKGRIVLHAFSEGDCEMCKKRIVTGHIPCDKVCEECSEKYNLCHICGEKLNGQERNK